MGLDATLYVETVRPPDDEWKRMFAAYEACKAAGIAPPADVDRFFDYREPAAEGMTERVAYMGVIRGRSTEAGTPLVAGLVEGEDRAGFVLDLSKVPKGVKQLRVYVDLSY